MSYLFVFVYLVLIVAQGDTGIGLSFWKYLLQMNFCIKREMSSKSLKSNDNKSKHAMFLLRVLYF